MIKEKFNYQSPHANHEGILFTQDKDKARPVVLVAHAWYGRDDFAIRQAENLAKLGYVGIAVDNFGDAKLATNDSEASALIGPLFVNRDELRTRMVAALEKIQTFPFVDRSKVGAIGFCFGGLSVIELLRSGANLKGVVSFHGVIANSIGGKPANLAPNQPMKGAFLLLHGADDPMNSWQDLERFAKELTDAKVDWEFDLYGHTSHAFTNPKANNPEKGLIYNSKIANRAFAKMDAFFKEVLK